MVNKRNNLKGLSIFVVLVALGFFITFFRLRPGGYLTFSDAAKFADIARNIANGLNYGSSFKFFSFVEKNDLVGFPFPDTTILPVVPMVMAFIFKIFGSTDLSVIIFSGIFYLLSALFIFLLGKKLFGNLVGFLSAMALSSNPNVLDYATSGASEILYIFQIILVAYLISFNKKLHTILGLLVMMTMYFTRPQSFIIIAGYFLFLLLNKYRLAKAIRYFVLVLLVYFLIDYFVFYPLSGNYFLYSIADRGMFSVTQHVSEASVSNTLRGSTYQQVNYIAILKRTFYNLFNFYKLLPQIISPYMWLLFLISLLKWGKDNLVNSFKLSTVFIVVVSFIVTAITIPFFRYIHPIIPLVYLFATAALVWIVERLIGGSWEKIKKYLPAIIRKKEILTILISTLIILFSTVGQTLGLILLDSRFKATIVNIEKPPVYVQLSRILREQTNTDDLIVTNLDTWGSWYGERKTIWYPLTPEQLNLEGYEVSFDVIYLTSYLIDDENYYMGKEWRELLFDTENITSDYIINNFELAGSFKVNAADTYEDVDAKAVLYVRKSQMNKFLDQ